jgi:hypothetical protein
MRPLFARAQSLVESLVLALITAAVADRSRMCRKPPATAMEDGEPSTSFLVDLGLTARRL